MTRPEGTGPEGTGPRETGPAAVDRATVRGWDRRAIEEFGIPGIVLMENAALGCLRVLEELAPAELGPPYTVICGPGNNGGDGLALARHLHNRGLPVSIHLVEDASRIDPASDAGINLRIVQRMKVPLREPGPRLPELRHGAIIDAMLGTGLARPLGEPYTGWVEAINRSGRPVAAIDIPTGLDADSGEVLGRAVRAGHTIAMAAPKLGFTRGAGPAHVGRVHVVDIGLPRILMGGEVMEGIAERPARSRAAP